MSMIFPGMDPYLEHPQLWTGLHARLIVYIGNHSEDQTWADERIRAARV